MFILLTLITILLFEIQVLALLGANKVEGTNKSLYDTYNSSLNIQLTFTQQLLQISLPLPIVFDLFPG